ncbi:hypothetical protein ONZ43_g2826 [Nemania bipapillata]|uniref:Uncharacterized protein n=1 Tax=Nemania bipapillata TaxID=110536 RepID=A0ACC2IZ34_9PEZI|nr:hypothetical protein ONZ43_g2826 [Nemania bipapillata]
MTEVAPADRTRLLQSKRAECSAIARSRKRKLCILYEVTVSHDVLPRRSFNTPDAYEHPPTEKQFLDACDILQYVLSLSPCDLELADRASGCHVALRWSYKC